MFSGRVGLFKTNLMERPPMTDETMNVRFCNGPESIPLSSSSPITCFYPHGVAPKRPDMLRFEIAS